jgi:hypothetical protein
MGTAKYENYKVISLGFSRNVKSAPDTKPKGSALLSIKHLSPVNLIPRFITD